MVPAMAAAVDAFVPFRVALAMVAGRRKGVSSLGPPFHVAANLSLAHAPVRAGVPVALVADVVPLGPGAAIGVAAKAPAPREGLGLASAHGLRRVAARPIVVARPVAPADVDGQTGLRAVDTNAPVAPVGGTQGKKARPEVPVADGVTVPPVVLAVADMRPALVVTTVAVLDADETRTRPDVAPVHRLHRETIQADAAVQRPVGLLPVAAPLLVTVVEAPSILLPPEEVARPIPVGLGVRETPRLATALAPGGRTRPTPRAQDTDAPGVRAVAGALVDLLVVLADHQGPILRREPTGPFPRPFHVAARLGPRHSLAVLHTEGPILVVRRPCPPTRRTPLDGAAKVLPAMDTTTQEPVVRHEDEVDAAAVAPAAQITTVSPSPTAFAGRVLLFPRPETKAGVGVASPVAQADDETGDTDLGLLGADAPVGAVVVGALA